MSVATSIASAGRWLLQSGIQQPTGGFARYYDAETGRNRAVSTEISGYAASALVYLFHVTGDEAYLDCARRTACFLVKAWDAELQTFPFEHPSPSSESEHLSYFFDCGIIIRGLLAVWRATGEEQLLQIARDASRSMIADFRAHPEYHPILTLPDKTPLPRSDQWSRGPGCYQLKSALAWHDVAEITGDGELREAWLETLESALSSHSNFLAGASCEHKTMDRLHPYCYFLEGLTVELSRPECVQAYVEGISAIGLNLRKIAPSFARSDVYAQLLRARLYAGLQIPVDHVAAEEEAEALSAFQLFSDDPRIDGGFDFGRRGGALSRHMNPVSTSFAIQALEMWREYQVSALASGEWKPRFQSRACGNLLI